MAASVQHHHGALWCCIERGEHAVKVDVFFAGVVVSVSFDCETRVGKQTAMVFPARVRNQDLGFGVQVAQKISADFQAACAAQTLHRSHTARGDGLRICAKYQMFDRGVIGCDAVNRQVTTRARVRHHGFFGRLHAL